MEKLKKEFSSILESYLLKYETSKENNGGFEGHLNNVKKFSKLFEELVDEIVEKSNEYTNLLKKEDIIELSNETILKFKLV